MSSHDLLAALRPVVDALTHLGVPHYVGGSIAASVHGVPRSSLDADVVADLQPPHGRPLVEALQATYYVPEGHVEEAIARRTSFNVIHLASMVKVDVFVTRDRPFDRRALARARPTALAGETPVAVCSAEDTVLAKLEWYRRGGETSERQWTDVIGLLRVGRDLDLGYLRDGAGELGVGDLLARAITESGAP